MIEEIKEEQRK